MHIKDAISSDDELKPVNGAPTTVVTVPGLRSLLPMNFEWIFQRLCTEYKVSGSARVPIINGIYTKKTGPEEEQHAVYFQTSFNATVKADVAGVDKVTVDTAHEGIKAGMVVTGDGVEAGAPKADGAAASPPPVKVVSIADSVVTLSVAQKALKAGTVLSFAIDPSNADHTEKTHVLCWNKSGHAWVIAEDVPNDSKVVWQSGVPIINGIYTKKAGLKKYEKDGVVKELDGHAVYLQTSFNATVKADVAGVDKVTVDTAHEGIKAGMVVTGDGVEAGAPKADGAAASPPPVKVVSIADSVVTLSVAQKALKAGTVLSFAIDPSNTDHTEKPHVLCWDKSGWVITEDYDILHHDDKVLWHSVRAHEPEETSTLGGQGPQNAVDTTWTSKPASELKPHTTWLSKPGGYFGLKPEDKPWPGETSLTVEGVPLA